MVYVLCVEGLVKKTTDSGDEVIMQRHDGCEVKPGGGSNNITLTFNAIGSEVVEGADLSAHVLMFEMAHVIGSGRMDLQVETWVSLSTIKCSYGIAARMLRRWRQRNSA